MKKKWTRATANRAGVLAIILSILLPVPARSQAKSTLGDHYLMLVSSLTAAKLTQDRLTLFDQSPYDGTAVSFLTGPYDTSAVPTSAEMAEKLSQAKKLTKKDLWPWVFFNRLVGRDPDLDTPYGREPYFQRIHGADLENKANAQDDFLQLWRNSLQAANATKAPGIVVDLEYYVNYKAYDPFVLAKQLGKTPAETVDLLKKMGARLADAAAREYPNAALWFLFTDLGQLGAYVVDHVNYYPTPAYIVLGLLDQIHDKGYSLKVISGGEVALGYCSFSLDHLKKKIKTRSVDFAPHLQKYGSNLELSGTMILWRDRAAKTEFMGEGVCAQSDAPTLEDLQPYLELLLKTYRFNWIYGTGNAGYDPFHPRSAPRFDAMIKKAKQNVYNAN